MHAETGEGQSTYDVVPFSTNPKLIFMLKPAEPPHMCFEMMCLLALYLSISLLQRISLCPCRIVHIHLLSVIIIMCVKHELFAAWTSLLLHALTNCSHKTQQVMQNLEHWFLRHKNTNDQFKVQIFQMFLLACWVHIQWTSHVLADRWLYDFKSSSDQWISLNWTRFELVSIKFIFIDGVVKTDAQWMVN